MRGLGDQRSSLLEQEQDGSREVRVGGDAPTTSRGAPRAGQSRERGTGGQRERKKPVVCRFYATSSCKYGNRCKYYHPRPPSRANAVHGESGDGEKRPSPSDARRTPSDLNLGMFMKTVKSRPPVQRPEAAGSKNAGDLLNVSIVL